MAVGRLHILEQIITLDRGLRFGTNGTPHLWHGLGELSQLKCSAGCSFLVVSSRFSSLLFNLLPSI